MKSIESRIEKAEKTVIQTTPEVVKVLPPVITFGKVNTDDIEREVDAARQYQEKHPGRMAPPIILNTEGKFAK